MPPPRGRQPSAGLKQPPGDAGIDLGLRHPPQPNPWQRERDHQQCYIDDSRVSPLIQASVQTGLDFNEDFNGANQEGAGYYQLNIRNGLRQSTARTYLAQCEQRPNLTLETSALANRVLIEDGRAVDRGQVCRA